MLLNASLSSAKKNCSICSCSNTHQIKPTLTARTASAYKSDEIKLSKQNAATARKQFSFFFSKHPLHRTRCTKTCGDTFRVREGGDKRKRERERGNKKEICAGGEKLTCGENWRCKNSNQPLERKSRHGLTEGPPSVSPGCIGLTSVWSGGLQVNANCC